MPHHMQSAAERFSSSKRLASVLFTIRLRARDFYAVIVDESEARINYHRIKIESNLIVLVGSEVKHGIFNEKFDF